MGRSLTVPVLVLVLALALAGCVQTPAIEVDPAIAAPEIPGAAEKLLAPVFGTPVAIPFPPASLGGEPSVAAAPDGTIYVSAPMIPLAELFTSVAQGYVWRSDDGGRTYTMLNDEQGKLDGDACGNGDTDVAVDDNGSVYMVDLCGGIPFYVSHDKGETWKGTEDVTQREEGDRTHSRDRQWIDALGEGHVLVSVAGSEDAEVRSIVFVQSRDAGKTWSEKQVLATRMIQLGPMVFVNHSTYAMPYVEPEGGSSPPERSAGIVHVLLTRDGGQTWTDSALDRRVTPAFGLQSAGWSPTHIFPVLEADAAGNLYLAWSEDTPDHLGSRLVFTRSLDGGATWDEPVELTSGGNAIFPWLAAGTDGRVALAYLRAETPLEPNRSPGPWYVHMMQTVTGSAETVEWVDARAVAEPVHYGGVCQNGGSCTLGVDSIGDRTLLDFFEVAIVPTTGQAVIAYTTDPPQEGKQVRVATVVQTGGTSLLAGKVLG